MVTIDADRFEKTFRRYSQIGRTDDDGLHRLTLTETDRNVRDLFVEDLESLGLDIRIDEIGNIFGRRPGTDPDAAPVLIGSHLDSQPYGGRFDGRPEYSQPLRRSAPSRMRELTTDDRSRS